MTSIRKTKKALKREIRRTESYLKSVQPTTIDLMRERIGAKAYLATLGVRLRLLKGENFTDATFVLPNDIKIDTSWTKQINTTTTDLERIKSIIIERIKKYDIPINEWWLT